MVAAGATILMAASEETSSNGTGNNSTQCGNQAVSHHTTDSHSNKKMPDSSTKKDNSSPSNNKSKAGIYMLDKTNRVLSRTDNKDNGKIVVSHKTTPVRETKASRLRAASILSPNGTSLSKRLSMSECPIVSNVQPGTSVSVKEENAISNPLNPINPIRERDKSYKRKSYLNRSHNMEVSMSDHINQLDGGERRVKRQSNKASNISETVSPSECTQRQTSSGLQKKNTEQKSLYQRVSTQNVSNRSKICSSSSVSPFASVKCSNVQHTSGGYSDSEVSRRVDVLTALTKATMERVERLASHSNMSVTHGHERRLENQSTANAGNVTDTNIVHGTPVSPKKSSILKKPNDEQPPDGSNTRHHIPVSILKHKVSDTKAGQLLSSTSHTPLPVTFSPSVVEPTRKRHGILKKRCSLDENEILRRRSCSPDVSQYENSSEFRPILKNQRRSSLDEIIKRDQSPDPQPTSILKRKTSRGDDREDRQIGLSEPQGILKRKSVTTLRVGNGNHHVSIATDTPGPSGPQIVEGSEVKPILKKKHSKEESFGNDVPSVEPRPILKKKSSTESDEHDDKPKKTILKCARKSSQDDCSYEAESTSPKRLSMFRNRLLQSRATGFDTDPVRPILKQSGTRETELRTRLNFCDGSFNDDDTRTESPDRFLRKRAQSLGHVQPTNDFIEVTNVLTKRRSLELSSMNEVFQETVQSNETSSDNHVKVDIFEHSDNNTPLIIAHNATSSAGKDKLADKTNFVEFDTHEKERFNLITLPGNTGEQTIGKMNDDECVFEQQVQKKLVDRKIEDQYGVARSNSVSKMTMHFKALQEKASSADKDNICQRNTGSRGIQRYRDRKLPGNDRFNTQPVTFQEVQEAVLQNQRNATCNETGKSMSSGENVTIEDEFDPSKLSLAERVRLFNQKIATENSPISIKMSQEKHSRRRPTNRYKTQPVTSEEVEVASRISPFHTGEQFSLDGTNENNGEDNSSASKTDLPKSILKTASFHSYKTRRTTSPELQGLKLIKSVLKKEAEDVDQQSENSETFPRSILKKGEDNNSFRNALEVKDVNVSAKCQNASTNINSEKQATCTIDYDQTVYHNLHFIVDPGDNTQSESIQNEVTQIHTVPFNQNITQNVSRTKPTIDDVDNVQTENTECNRRAGDKKARETHKPSENEILPSHRHGSNATKNGNEGRYHAILSKQSRFAALSKSASHHALGHETYQNGASDRRLQSQAPVPLLGLCRSATQAIPATDAYDGPSMSIADRLAALQRSGNTSWKRRAESVNLSDSSYTCAANKEEWSIKQGVLADCLGKLESATEGWKKRIAASDATKFTVAGKMKVEQMENVESVSSSPLAEVSGSRKKKTPRPERFKARKECIQSALSTPTSPNKDVHVNLRGSFSEPASDDSGEECKTSHTSSPTVSVPKTDDETFTSFFTGLSFEKCETESLDLDESDFDIITSRSELLIQKRNIRIQRRRGASRNPIKALAARTDLKSEYTEIRTGVAEKVLRQLNVEKLAKHSNLAVEALAGLASTEDFSTVTLRNAAEVNVSTNKLQPHKDLMLILVKGRRHVQVRLIEPVVESINSGDNFVLVTKSEVFNYIGRYSNVIERARGAEIALSIQQNKDLGCHSGQVITISEDKVTCTKSQLQKFWKYLGADRETIDVLDGGHPDEDELFESAIIDTNMVYEIHGDELVPLDKYWGAIPKIDMLDPSKVLVFDFGSEMYIWSGKAANAENKRIAVQLATQMWNEGYDYTECAICPIDAARVIGIRNKGNADIKSAKTRPTWCLLAKVTQHVETVLFREKFLDWPNVTGIIRVREPKTREQVDGSIRIDTCDVNDMLKESDIPVDLVLEGSHLGRGTGWYDDELRKQYVVTTTNVTAWYIDEFSHTLLDKSSVGQFYSGDSYIVKWMYSITITGRELSGMPSKHAAKGRDRSVYFIWQGKNASLNEQGAAALLTIELDSDQAPQIRIAEGHEPAAFLNLFSGSMVIHNGKKADKSREQRWRLYTCRGCLESEVSLLEVPCSTRQLRSRGSLLLIDTEKNIIYVWYGCHAMPHIKKNAFNAATTLINNRPEEFGLCNSSNTEVLEINEGKEPDDFFNGLGGANKKLYVSLENKRTEEYTPRLFYFTCISKEFKAVEILCPHRAQLPTPFPFLQDELYQASQPALFLLDSKSELWIWQGWWPNDSTEDQTGSKAVRWQAERKAAMTTALEYWQKLYPGTTKFPIYLVWAGLEPLQFINLFPSWTYRDDIAKLNIEDGRNSGEVLTVDSELARLTQSTYPPAQLLQRPLPEGVDPTHLELYLSHQHFQELLGMSKAEFQELPAWKQVNLKKEIGLF